MRAIRFLVETVLGLTVLTIASPLTDTLRKEAGSPPAVAWVQAAGAGSGVGAGANAVASAEPGARAGAARDAALPDPALQQLMTLEPSSLAMLGLVITIVGVRLLRKTLGV